VAGELHHYVVVRRDLPFGVICAQLAHAAGESFYLLSDIRASVAAASSEAGGVRPSARANHAGVAQRKSAGGSLPEVVGSSPSPGSIPKPTVVVLGARSLARLETLERHLLRSGLPHVAVREPDAPWDGQLMAIGLVPAERDAIITACRSLLDYQVLSEEHLADSVAIGLGQ
jgi:hypothetical protein